jgi:hypothetical protein
MITRRDFLINAGILTGAGALTPTLLANYKPQKLEVTEKLFQVYTPVCMRFPVDFSYYDADFIRVAINNVKIPRGIFKSELPPSVHFEPISWMITEGYLVDKLTKTDKKELRTFSRVRGEDLVHVPGARYTKERTVLYGYLFAKDIETINQVCLEFKSRGDEYKMRQRGFWYTQLKEQSTDSRDELARSVQKLVDEVKKNNSTLCEFLVPLFTFDHEES